MPIATEPAGHVVVPGLCFVDKKKLTKEEKHRKEDISQQLAQAASSGEIYSPPEMVPPGD